MDLEAEVIHTDDAVQDSALESRDRAKGGPVLAHGKRLSIGDLLQAGLIREGDQWRLSLKGEVIWGRIESNGQLEVSNQSHGNPSKAFQAATGKPGNGWYYWHSRAASGEWQRIDALRSEYRRHVGTANLALVQDATARYGVARPHRPTDGSSGLMADARLRRSRGPRCGGAPGEVPVFAPPPTERRRRCSLRQSGLHAGLGCRRSCCHGLAAVVKSVVSRCQNTGDGVRFRASH